MSLPIGIYYKIKPKNISQSTRYLRDIQCFLERLIRLLKSFISTCRCRPTWAQSASTRNAWVLRSWVSRTAVQTFIYSIRKWLMDRTGGHWGRSVCGPRRPGPASWRTIGHSLCNNKLDTCGLSLHVINTQLEQVLFWENEGNHWFYRDFTKVYQIAQWHHHEMPELLINKPIELRYSPRPEQNHNPIATYDRNGQNEEKSAVFVSTTFIEIQTLRDCVLIACWTRIFNLTICRPITSRCNKFTEKKNAK